jgi:hypothetical protein
MLTAIEHTVQAISAVVQTVPIGTDRALLHMLWSMMSNGQNAPNEFGAW